MSGDETISWAEAFQAMADGAVCESAFEYDDEYVCYRIKGDIFEYLDEENGWVRSDDNLAALLLYKWRKPAPLDASFESLMGLWDRRGDHLCASELAARLAGPIEFVLSKELIASIKAKVAIALEPDQRSASDVVARLLSTPLSGMALLGAASVAADD